MADFEIIIVLSVLVFLIISLYSELFKPITAFFVAIVLFSVTDILTPQEILTGFANEQIAVIILLLIVGNIIQKTSIIDSAFAKLFEKAKTNRGFLWRMHFYIAFSSTVFNNTPLVAMMMPYIESWSKKNKGIPSKLLIPLSYSAIIGGTATLIGTSTNLIVNGMVIAAGEKSLNIFDFAWVGFPMIFISFLYMYFFAEKLLPVRQSAFQIVSSENQREYLVEAIIKKDSDICNKTIAQAGFRNIKGLFLVEIIRKDERLPAVSPTELLQSGDKLIFAGETTQIIELLKNNNDIIIPQADNIILKEKTELVEVIISINSSLINKKIRKGNFRSRYDAAIVAVHRNGERLNGRIGDITLKAGDILLLLTGKNFDFSNNDDNDFYFISNVDAIHKMDTTKRNILMWGLVITILFSVFKIASLFKSLIVLLALIMLFKIASSDEIRKSINYKIIAIDGMALGLGLAMINSGTATLLSDLLLNIFAPLGVVWLLAGVFIITNILASYMTNVAAVSIIFPISLESARQLMAAGEISSLVPFMLVVAYAGAANFITPIGYQTNLMVYGAGGYNFKDFLKIGFPLAVLFGTVTVLILSFVYKLF
jgi:di/tricarboxylate transporter